MTKFLFFTDIHLSGNTPRHRIDNFPKTMVNKLREVYEIAKSNHCEFVIFGGDFFNTHRIFSYEVISDTMDIICDADIPLYACIGEHDLFGHSPNTFPSSTLAFLVRRCQNYHILFEPKDLGNIVLYAKHEWQKMEEAMNTKVDSSKLNVLLCHELITNKPAMFDIIQTSSLVDCPFDIVLSGDLHDGYETHKVGNTVFCNPGSLARRAINDSYRLPQIAIIEAEKGKEPNIQFQVLSCAKKGEEVFSKSILEMLKDDNVDGDNFTTEMMGFESESIDVHDLIQKVGAKNGVRKEVLDYLAQKREVEV